MVLVLCLLERLFSREFREKAERRGVTRWVTRYLSTSSCSYHHTPEVTTSLTPFLLTLWSRPDVGHHESCMFLWVFSKFICLFKSLAACYFIRIGFNMLNRQSGVFLCRGGSELEGQRSVQRKKSAAGFLFSHFFPSHRKHFHRNLTSWNMININMIKKKKKN